MRTTQAMRQTAAEAELDAELFELCSHLPDDLESQSEPAILALCARVEVAVRRMAGKALRSTFDVEDLCQEGLMALLAASRRGAREGGATGAARAHSILRARMVDLARRRSARKRAEVSTHLLGDLEPLEFERALGREDADPLAELELVTKLAAELAALPAEQREALEARVFEGLPTADVATRLERSEQAVRQLLLRARRRLRRTLG